MTKAILAAYSKLPGGTSAEIAALAGVQPEAVRVVLRRKGLVLAHRRPPRPKRTKPLRRYRRLLDWERAAIAAAYAAGEKLEAIAVEFDSRISTVYRVAMAEGVPKRSPDLSGRLKNRNKAETYKALRKRLAEERKRAIAARAAAKEHRKRRNNDIPQGLETTNSEN